MAYVFGGVCLNFTEIKDFRQPIRLWGQAFRGYEIEVKTPIYKKFKPGPERLTRKDQQEENKSKKKRDRLPKQTIP